MAARDRPSGAPGNEPDTVLLSIQSFKEDVVNVEAFASRGNGDYIASADVEDIISVVDGYGDIANEIARTNERLRNYLSKAVRSWLDDSEFVATLPGHLAGDAASQARLPVVLDRLRQIAGQ